MIRFFKKHGLLDREAIFELIVTELWQGKGEEESIDIYRFNEFMAKTAKAIYSSSSEPLYDLYSHILSNVVRLKEIVLADTLETQFEVITASKMIDSFFTWNKLKLVSDFSIEFENIYTIYYSENYKSDSIVYDLSDIYDNRIQLTLKDVYNFLRDTEIVPVYLTIEDFVTLYCENFEAEEKKLKHAFIFGEEQGVVYPKVSLFDMVCFVCIIGLKIIAKDDLDMFDVNDVIHDFFKEYLYIRKNVEIVAEKECYNPTTPFLQRVIKHNSKIRETLIVSQNLKQEVKEYKLKQLKTFDHFTEKEISKKELKEMLKDIPELEIYDFDEKKVFREKARQYVIGEQIPKEKNRPRAPPRNQNRFNKNRNVVPHDPFFDRKPIKHYVHDYEHQFHFKRRLKKENDNLDITKKALYTLKKEEELIYEFFEPPTCSDDDLEKLIEIMYYIHLNNMIEGLKLIISLMESVEERETRNTVLLHYLLYLKGMAYMMSVKEQEAESCFYRCVTLSK